MAAGAGDSVREEKASPPPAPSNESSSGDGVPSVPDVDQIEIVGGGPAV